MNSKFAMVPVLGLMLFSSAGLMASPAIQEMVAIMLQVNEYPTASEKATLYNIAADSASSDNESIMAMALMNLQRSVTDAEKDVLLGIANNDQAPAADRKLAGILANVNYVVSDADREELEKLK